MINLLAKFNFSFSSVIAQRVKNPYLTLSPSQLQPIITAQLNKTANSIGDINTLIGLGLATANNKMGELQNKLLLMCVKDLNTVYSAVNEYQQQELSLLDFGELLKLINSSSHLIDERALDKVSSMYANTYIHILNFTKQIAVYENSCENVKLDFVKSLAYKNIKYTRQNRQLSLHEYIEWLRVFKTQTTPFNINLQLKQFLALPNLCKVNEEYKLILAYLVISAGANWNLVEQLDIVPNLEIYETSIQEQNPKLTCLKYQIRKYLNKQISNLSKLDLTYWDYKHLIWISEFVPQDDEKFKESLHNKLINSQLPKSMQPSTIFIYLNNIKISTSKHIQVSNWLCRQSYINSQCQQSLCRMLIEIHEKKWAIFYEQFYKFVLKLSLGTFKWENQNIVYYLGTVWKINDENMEYLRRYIIHSYASLGTARREIPTSSYFYKILEVANVQKFYGNL